ncbi:hypothetical protein HNQ03_001495 [Chryseobacterium sp. 16F]|uniref:Uncharacterized protein n=1 Tax=Frigoriflavimonas asaccharolytica TaxID=2735899 RepID=A0A8J8G9I7_9FLAO|nr:hypothetical protein [Frigoriflavimonas asaccharolytica]
MKLEYTITCNGIYAQVTIFKKIYDILANKSNIGRMLINPSINIGKISLKFESFCVIKKYDQLLKTM